ncbi:hypothetical protein R1CP_05795 [Rhodococcus opacus]|uniref:SnoaL-like domain-containing protein n=1 Tax=Rhodococcus opacus TaxID=37919 RepID=A0A1B1JZY3_RHOOP|nr:MULTISPECIES: nuclear transport factor 2 family protein [Rhodococcus]ANS25887.1 hypothetical protein R1CP_05795 [Rhodococcus opacus]UOT05321.1 nuclear transport factor 2 family protein [Rhodococcus opacus]GLK36138.1 polyketide cyclase [Rhodococcus wratislaviensis]
MSTTTTPEIVTRYFRAADAGDLDALTACFTDNAAVTDEGRTVRGRDGIRQWRKDLESKYIYTVEVIGAETVTDDTYVITTTVKGNFPGSPVELKYEFVLSDGLVDTLRIAP